MKQKIKNINIKGFRGVKDEINLLVNEKSALFYGDNGTGKSTIVDAIEWFYTDNVKHLSGEEIDKKTSLRNIKLSETENASILLDFSQENLKSEKSLIINRAGGAISSFSNGDDDFLNYYNESKKENLLLRYRDLENFITASKGEKLKTLSDIIGYEEVTKTKEVIKKSYNSIKSEIKSQGFENQLQAQQVVLIEHIGVNINSEEELFEELNNLIKPLNIEVIIKSLTDIPFLIEKIKSPADQKLIEELKFLQNIYDVLVVLKEDTETIDLEYQCYYDEFEKIFNDVESIKQTLLKKVLTEGKDVLCNNHYNQDNCPLCLKDEEQKVLISKIDERLKDIEESSEKLKDLEKNRDLINLTIKERVRRLNSLLLDNELINSEKYLVIKSFVVELKDKLNNYYSEIEAKVLSGKMIKKNSELKLKETDFITNTDIEIKLSELNKKIPKDINSDVRVKIEFAQSSFLKITELKSKEKILKNQLESLGLIYNEFVKRQKEGLEAFILSLSSTINEFYQYMNPGELFEDLEIISIEDEDELKGITIQFKFNGIVVSPPQKYFSESHINCYGLAFFLASVKEFNIINKFIIFDDVISSFDTNHRKKFADLLFEKFSDYQIILLTHEIDWFTYVKGQAKNKGWLIKKICFNDENGTHIEKSPSELGELIEYQISNGIETQLGNSIRTYLEHKLKEICYNLETKFSFRFNDQNEKRMSDELLSSLRAAINKKSINLKSEMVIIDRVANSTILGNLLSHDNSYNPAMGDLKAFWVEIKDLENLFICKNEGCNNMISMKYYDNVEKKIRCSCGKISYMWTL